MSKSPYFYVVYTEWDEKGNLRGEVVTGEKVVASFRGSRAEGQARDHIIDEYMFSDYAGKYPPTDYYLDDIGNAVRICNVRTHDVHVEWKVVHEKDLGK